MARKSRISKSEKNANKVLDKQDGYIKEDNKVAILEHLIYPSLTFFETCFLIATWTIFLLYMWYLAYIVSQKHYTEFAIPGENNCKQLQSTH